MEKTAHFFYALRIPKKEQQLLFDKCQKLREVMPFGRWVHFEDYHITLAFLGNAEENQLQSSIRLVREVVPNVKSFSLQINQLGAFGQKDAPRIFWAGVEKEITLDTVRDQVYKACTAAGFKLETRPFHPHITIARKWSGSVPFRQDLLIENNPFKDEPIRFSASEVVLYRTHLDRVPKYEAVQVFPLGKENMQD
jgi:2'-5' RNA ligase